MLILRGAIVGLLLGRWFFFPAVSTPELDDAMSNEGLPHDSDETGLYYELDDGQSRTSVVLAVSN